MKMLTALVQEIIFRDVTAVLQTIFCYTESFSVSLLSAWQLHLKRSDDCAPLIDSRWWTIISLFRVTCSIRLIEMIDRRSHHRWPSGFSARFRCLYCWETRSVVQVHWEWPYYSEPWMNEWAGAWINGQYGAHQLELGPQTVKVSTMLLTGACRSAAVHQSQWICSFDLQRLIVSRIVPLDLRHLPKRWLS